MFGSNSKSGQNQSINFYEGNPRTLPETNSSHLEMDGSNLSFRECNLRNALLQCFGRTQIMYIFEVITLFFTSRFETNQVSLQQQTGDFKLNVFFFPERPTWEVST